MSTSGLPDEFSTMRFGIVLLLLPTLLCAFCGRHAPEACRNGHKLRRLQWAPHGWSISTRGLCYLCSEQVDSMSAGGKKSKRRKPGTNVRNAARAAETRARQSPPQCDPARTLCVEIWSGGRSKVSKAASRYGLIALRISAPTTRAYPDRRIWRWPERPGLEAGQTSTWQVDLDQGNQKHDVLTFLREQCASGSSSRIIVITNPPCTPWSRWQSLNHSRILQMRGAKRRKAMNR